MFPDNRGKARLGAPGLHGDPAAVTTSHAPQSCVPRHGSGGSGYSLQPANSADH